MPSRTHAFAALAAGAAVLAVPAVASAAPAPSVVAGPVKVKAYSMSVVASKGSLSVLLSRRAGTSNQTHIYSASQGVAVKVNKALTAGTVTAPLGAMGTVKLKLHGAGALRKGTVPKGCTGTPGKSRAGTLTGTFKLQADGGRYFGTIKKGKLPAQVIKGGKLNCQAPGGGTPTPGGSSGSTLLSHSITEGDQLTSFSAIRQGGKVSESVTRIDSRAATAPLSVIHTISAPAPSGAFTTAADLSSATVQGAGRFITGSLSFTADDAFGSTATGTAAGSLAAQFDPLGAVSLTGGDSPAILTKG
jgi:hypothetical protein